MSFEKVNIICQQYVFHTSNASEANFFSGTARTANGDPIDLTEFCFGGLNPITYDFEVTSENRSGANEIFFSGSDFSLQLDDIKQFRWNLILGQISLSDYFYLTREWGPGSIPKWYVEVKYAGTVIWSGIISYENLKARYTNDENSHIIDCTIVEYIKEFADYFKNKPLPLADDAIFVNRWQAFPYKVKQWTGGAVSMMSPNSMALKTMLTTLFGVINIDLEGIKYDGGDWQVLRVPFFRNNDFLKCGYERAATSGNSCLEWLNGLCGAMGWVYYFSYKNGQRIFSIKNRADINLSVIPIEASDIDYEITKSSGEVTFNQIMLLEGTMIGGDSAFRVNNISSHDVVDFKGERIIIISDKTFQNFNNSHFQTISGARIYSGAGYTFTKYHNEDNTFFRTRTFRFANGGYSSKVDSFKKENILFVNCGQTGSEAAAYALDTDRNVLFSIGVTTFNDNDLVYTGNYGNMLFQAEMFSWDITMDYRKWIKTPNFRNNYLKFLDKNVSGTYIRMKVKGIYTDVHFTPQIVNADPVRHKGMTGNPKLAINKVEIDLEEETTIFEMTKLYGI